ncbi:hypothetical protein ACJJTC_004866 [Scirpophaga incertulas]
MGLRRTLFIYIRRVDKSYEVHEKLLDMYSVHGTTTGTDIFKGVEIAINQKNLRWKALMSKAVENYGDSKPLVLPLDNKEKSAIQAHFANLQSKYEKLSAVDNKILDLWLDQDDRDDNVFEADMVSIEVYNDRWYALQQRYKEFIEDYQSSKQELLRVWERATCQKDLEKLLQFIKNEVESEQRIKLSRGIVYQNVTPSMSTAACLDCWSYEEERSQSY